MKVLQHGHVLLEERRFEMRLGAPQSSRLPITHQLEVHSTGARRRCQASTILPLYSCHLAALPRCQVVSRPRHSVNTPPQTTSDGCSSWAAQVRISAGGVPSSECTASKLCAVCGRNTGRDGTSPQQRQAQAQTRGRGHDGVGARRSCSD